MKDLSARYLEPRLEPIIYSIKIRKILFLDHYHLVNDMNDQNCFIKILEKLKFFFRKNKVLRRIEASLIKILLKIKIFKLIEKYNS